MELCDFCGHAESEHAVTDADPSCSAEGCTCDAMLYVEDDGE